MHTRCLQRPFELTANSEDWMYFFSRCSKGFFIPYFNLWKWLNNLYFYSRTHFCNNFLDFKWAFGLNQLSLSLFGVWPKNNANINSYYARVPTMVMTIILGITIPQVYALTKVFSELPLVIDNMTTNCAALTAAAKLFLIWYNRVSSYSTFLT